MNSEPSPLQRVSSRALPGIAAVAGFSFCINLLLLTLPLYLMQIFDRVLPSRSGDTLILLFAMASGALLALAALDAVRSYLLARIGARFADDLSRPVFGRTIALQFGTNTQGRLRGLNDLGILRGFVAGPAVVALIDAPWTPIFIVAIFLLHADLGWLALCGGLALLAVAAVGERASRPALASAAERTMSGLAEADASLRNADVVEAMGMKPTMVERWHRRTRDAIELELAASERVGLIKGFSRFLRLLLQIGVMTLGAWLVIEGELTAGGMTAATLLLARALGPVEQIIAASRSIASALAAYRRLRALLALPPARKTRHPLPAPTGRLSVNDLMFAYPDQRQPTLRSVTFGLEPGEALGIVGPTAAGKTTLARLLVGNLAPRAGCVRLDGIDVATWDHDDLGRHIGYLPQDVELFSGTVRENIARMAEARSPPGTAAEPVIEAARLAGVHEMILALPHGYETEIGRAGMALSGGQRQRIGLARALYGRPRLLVLDEPNANLDRDGEMALVRAIALCKRRACSIVVIAHRVQVLSQVDSILLLRNGNVAILGRRDEVIQHLSGQPLQRASATEERALASGTTLRLAADEPRGEGDA